MVCTRQWHKSEVEFRIFANILHYLFANMNNCKVSGHDANADIAHWDEKKITTHIFE
tara:strand:+ start:325 stop:495 length:171 start_codon:yes stop_codon:yes gene_type:complete